MNKNVVVVPASLPLRELLAQFFFAAGERKHQGYPVVDGAGHLQGVVTRSNLLGEWVSEALSRRGDAGPWPIVAFDLIDRPAVTAFP
jgi:hypothetical protein